MLASDRTIIGSLPPSSNVQPFSCLAQSSPTVRPTSTEPVKKILPTPRVVDHRLADAAAAVHGADQALGQAGFVEDVLDPLAEQAGQAGRLEDHAVARHQRDRDLVERDRPRVVPGAITPTRRSARSGSVILRVFRKACVRRDLLVGEDLRWRCWRTTAAVDRRQELHRVGLGARLALLAVISSAISSLRSTTTSAARRM